MTKELAVRDDKEVALYEIETQFALAVRQRELLEDYIKDRLKPAKHYYKVSEGQKPSLTKEGAELVCLPHALKPRYAIVSGPENPPMDDNPYQITVNCELAKGEQFAGQGIGSANSMVTKKTGERVQRQKDPGLRHNATLKMACKSAYIAATLNATAASEFFTQDLEDDHIGSYEKAEKPQSQGHYCSEHGVVFFKKGKMKQYAHPIEGTDPVQWCNEEKAEATTSTQPKDQPTEGIPEFDATPVKNLGDLFQRCKNYGITTEECLSANGVSDKNDLTDLDEAWGKAFDAKFKPVEVE